MRHPNTWRDACMHTHTHTHIRASGWFISFKQLLATGLLGNSRTHTHTHINTKNSTSGTWLPWPRSLLEAACGANIFLLLECCQLSVWPVAAATVATATVAAVALSTFSSCFFLTAVLVVVVAVLPVSSCAANWLSGQPLLIIALRCLEAPLIQLEHQKQCISPGLRTD